VRKPNAAQQLARWLSDEIVARLRGAAMSLTAFKIEINKLESFPLT
jgi:hypothetical protein